jgi:hypothetical protein
MGFATAEMLRRSASYFSQVPYARASELPGSELPSSTLSELPPESLPAELYSPPPDGPEPQLDTHNSRPGPIVRHYPRMGEKPQFARRDAYASQGVVAELVDYVKDSGYHVPSCPVCNASLPGLTEQGVSLHVNGCLNSGITPPPPDASIEPAQIGATDIASTPAVSRYQTYRFAASASSQNNDSGSSAPQQYQPYRPFHPASSSRNKGSAPALQRDRSYGPSPPASSSGATAGASAPEEGPFTDPSYKVLSASSSSSTGSIQQSTDPLIPSDPVSNTSLIHQFRADRIAMYNQAPDIWAGQSQCSFPQSLEHELEQNAAQFENNSRLSFTAGENETLDIDDEIWNNRPSTTGATEDEPRYTRPSTPHPRSRAPSDEQPRALPTEQEQAASVYQHTNETKPRPKSEEYDEWHDTTEWLVEPVWKG